MSIEIYDFNDCTHYIEDKLDLSSYTPRQKIEIFEWILMNKVEGATKELPFAEEVHGGMYERSLLIPAGFVLTGKIHTKEHIFILLLGDISVMADEGMKRIQAPYRFNVKAGTKKIGFAHTDVLCTTIHKTDLTDIEEIRAELLQDSDLTWVDELMNNLIEQEEPMEALCQP